MYDPQMVKPMREELTKLGVEELLTPEEVDSAVQNTDGTLLLIVNSVCGCAAGGARPGVALALQNEKKPNKLATVFAGMEKDATNKAREYFVGYPPSSPCMGLLKDGEIVHMIERHDIEGKSPEEIASNLKSAFEQHC